MPYNYYPQNYYSQMQYQQGQTAFIRVQSEMQAREWPVAPGGSVTFVDDNAPYCYTKSMGVSQFDAPVFKRFRLVEEEASQSVHVAREEASPTPEVNLSDYLTRAEFEPFKACLEKLKKELLDDEPTE